MASRTLTLAFLRPLPSDDPINVLTARMSKHGMCHAELVFDCGQAFSIYHGGTVALRHRSLSNPGYETVSLSVPTSEYRACLQFCEAAHQSAYPFDSMGMYIASIHPGGCAHRSSAYIGRTFCSKIITEALQFAGVREVEGLSPSASTPSRLYAAVKDSERKICHSVRTLTKAGVALMMVEPMRMM